LFLLCLTSLWAYGQEGEFKIHNNGLIYDDVTMARLGAIVDSLNLKFRSCDLSKDGETAFYFSNLQPYTLPFECARLVQYVDCMIDTTAAIYQPRAKERVFQGPKPNTRAGDFMTWANSYPGKPRELDYKRVNDDNFDTLSEIYWRQYKEWDSLRRAYVEEQLKTSPERRRQLAEIQREGENTKTYKYSGDERRVRVSSA
jgi:hypothetical protein